MTKCRCVRTIFFVLSLFALRCSSILKKSCNFLWRPYKFLIAIVGSIAISFLFTVAKVVIYVFLIVFSTLTSKLTDLWYAISKMLYTVWKLQVNYLFNTFYGISLRKIGPMWRLEPSKVEIWVGIGIIFWFWFS